jgi:RHS repeat-associated protein
MYFGGRLLAPVDRLGSVRGNANGSIAYFPWGEEEKQSTGYTTPDGTDKYATYFRDGTTNGAGEDYANARYYNNNFGRFWSADPAGNAHANDPQSWNRYSYVGSDPVNRSDPSGLGSICTVWAADNSYCIVSVRTPFPFCWDGTEDDPVFTCFGEGWGTQGLPPKSSETCGTAFFSTFGLISNGEQDAVSVILGENSWNLMGTRQYSAGQSYGKGTGPVIGVSDVFLEDQYMADVILNRVAQWGGTLSSQASNPSQFNGYPAGAEKFQADMSIGADTTQCSDLLTAFSALRSQETTPRLNTSILYWGAVVWPGLNQGIAVPPGDFMIADTIFGSGPVHP